MQTENLMCLLCDVQKAFYGANNFGGQICLATQGVTNDCMTEQHVHIDDPHRLRTELAFECTSETGAAENTSKVDQTDSGNQLSS